MPGKGQKEPEIEEPREPNRAEEELMDQIVARKKKRLAEIEKMALEKARRIEAQGGPARLPQVAASPAPRAPLAATISTFRVTLYPPAKYPTLPQPAWCTQCRGPLDAKPIRAEAVDKDPTTGKPRAYYPWLWRCPGCGWSISLLLAPPPEEADIAVVARAS